MVFLLFVWLDNPDFELPYNNKLIDWKHHVFLLQMSLSFSDFLILASGM